MVLMPAVISAAPSGCTGGVMGTLGVLPPAAITVTKPNRLVNYNIRKFEGDVLGIRIASTRKLRSCRS